MPYVPSNREIAEHLATISPPFAAWLGEQDEAVDIAALNAGIALPPLPATDTTIHSTDGPVTLPTADPLAPLPTVPTPDQAEAVTPNV